MRPGPFDVDRALRLWRAGRSLSHIGLALGCSAACVKERLVAAGVEHRNGRLVPPEVSIEDLHALYMSTDEPFSSIARRLGTSKQALMGRLRTAKLLARKPRRSFRLSWESRC